MPRFSIVIPCYNAETTLPDTLASIAAQNFQDYEVICVDDGSSDGTRDIVRSAAVKDSRIVLWTNRGKGPSDARNLGVFEKATGEIIAFCDADDLWAPEKLARLHVAFEDTSVHAAYSKIAFFWHTPADATTISTLPDRDLTIPILLGENPVCTMSNLAIRRDRFLASGGFDPEIVHNEDLEWLIRVIGQGARVVGIDKVLTYYRANPDGLSADFAAMIRGRDRALRSAALFGHRPAAKDQAIFLRYLARRALRVGTTRTQALGFTLSGLTHSPRGFFSVPRRGVLTLCGSFAALVLPRRLSRALFSR